jgi:hypothetical protein
MLICLSSDHHEGEETVFFPRVETATGVKGIMEVNIEQHHAFHVPLEIWKQYAEACKNGSEKFDAAKFRSLIDAFAPILTTHLTDEIPTLLALDKYENKKDIVKAWGAFDVWVRKRADLVRFQSQVSSRTS